MHPSGEVGRFSMDRLSSPPGDWYRSLKGRMNAFYGSKPAGVNDGCSRTCIDCASFPWGGNISACTWDAAGGDSSKEQLFEEE